jgi:CheY-like chemotaxis protein
MKEILWIEDQPSRASALLPAVHNKARITFAHGFDQINYYLNFSPIKWDLILLDMDMGLMDGRDVTRCFLLDCKLPVIIISLNSYSANWAWGDLRDHYVESYYLPISENACGALDVNKKILEILSRD